MKDPCRLSYVVVDDDEDDRLLMRLALEKANRLLPIFEFSDGQEIIDYLTQNVSVCTGQAVNWLIVIDVNMPRLNGLETLRQLRQNPYWSQLPVLMLSTSNDQVEAQELLINGANGYITKPNSANEFVDIFDNFFAPWLTVGPN